MIIDYGTFSQRLRQRTDRWSLLETFVREWELPTADYPLVLPEDLTDAEARLGFSLPAAVWEWYLLPSQPYQLEPSLLTGSWMVDPEWLEVAGDFLPLHREQQDCCQWAIRVSDMSLTDPPVYIGAESLPWRLHNTTFSEFALHLVVRDIIGVRGYWAYAGTLN